jgi:hypothetical protein
MTQNGSRDFRRMAAISLLGSGRAISIGSPDTSARRGIKSMETHRAADIVMRFPGPITLSSPPTQWWILILLCGVNTAGSIFAIFISLSDPSPAASIGVAIGILGTAFFGAGIVLSIVCLRPGANSLQLNEAGFQVTHPFRKRAYRWSDVSDFSVSSGYRRSGHVIFKEAKPSLTISERIRAVLQDGRNGDLPDTYGLTGNDLGYLMELWQNLAMKRNAGPKFR